MVVLRQMEALGWMLQMEGGLRIMIFLKAEITILKLIFVHLLEGQIGSAL